MSIRAKLKGSGSVALPESRSTGHETREPSFRWSFGLRLPDLAVHTDRFTAKLPQGIAAGQGRDLVGQGLRRLACGARDTCPRGVRMGERSLEAPCVWCHE